MRISLTTRIEHTVNFFSSPDVATLGYFGLRDIFSSYITDSDGDFIVQDWHPRMKVSFSNIYPAALSELDLRLLKSFARGEEIAPADLRMVIQYLVNKNVLPSGDFVITFNDFR